MLWVVAGSDELEIIFKLPAHANDPRILAMGLAAQICVADSFFVTAPFVEGSRSRKDEKMQSNMCIDIYGSEIDIALRITWAVWANNRRTCTMDKDSLLRGSQECPYTCIWQVHQQKLACEFLKTSSQNDYHGSTGTPCTSPRSSSGSSSESLCLASDGSTGTRDSICCRTLCGGAQ